MQFGMMKMTEKKHENGLRDIPEKDVTQDLSRMSLSNRISALISPEKRAFIGSKRAQWPSAREVELPPDRRGFGPGLVPQGRLETAGGLLRTSARVVPEVWTQIHVLDRLEEAYRVLAMQPGVKGRSSSTVWPAMAVEKMGIFDMIELMGTGELEQRAEEKNRVRLQPTSLQISLMEQALTWPFQFLNDRPELAKAIQLRSMWTAMGADIRKRCERRGLYHDEFNRQWQAALSIITGTLLARKVPVT
jgi:hypothetical protein